ncbi:hypothetical protein GCM10017562_10260 [Streptomyces roseofulvus]
MDWVRFAPVHDGAIIRLGARSRTGAARPQVTDPLSVGLLRRLGTAGIDRDRDAVIAGLTLPAEPSARSGPAERIGRFSAAGSGG